VRTLHQLQTGLQRVLMNLGLLDLIRERDLAEILRRLGRDDVSQT